MDQIPYTNECYTREDYNFMSLDPIIQEINTDPELKRVIIKELFTWEISSQRFDKALVNDDLLKKIAYYSATLTKMLVDEGVAYQKNTLEKLKQQERQTQIVELFTELDKSHGQITQLTQFMELTKDLAKNPSFLNNFTTKIQKVIVDMDIIGLYSDDGITRLETQEYIDNIILALIYKLNTSKHNAILIITYYRGMKADKANEFYAAIYQ